RAETAAPAPVRGPRVAGHPDHPGAQVSGLAEPMSGVRIGPVVRRTAYAAAVDTSCRGPGATGGGRTVVAGGTRLGRWSGAAAGRVAAAAPFALAAAPVGTAAGAPLRRPTVTVPAAGAAGTRC